MAIGFKILGTGAGPGVPSYFCDCMACKEAQEDPRVARTRSGAVINTGKEAILIDASPDLRMQLVREKIRCLDYVFITHWHYDHFGGLGDLEFYVKLSRETPLKLFLPPEALGEFHSTYPFLHDVFDPVPWQFDQVYSFHNLMLTPLPAVHSVQTAGIFLKSEKTGKTMAYFTDTSGLSASTLQKIKNTDIFICDATFHGDNWYPHSHLSIEEAINLGQDVKAQKTILTHLAMHYSTPITVARLEQKIKNHSKVCLAFDGMELQL